jgi:signal transduction histidine kinase
MSPNPPAADPTAIDRSILGWIQELSPHGVLVTDTQMRILRWNLWLETNSGLNRDKVLNRSLFEVFPEIMKRRMDRYYHAAISGQVSLLSSGLHGYLLPFPSTVREAGFLNMLQTARIAPLVEHGEVVGTITTIEDVTQREFQNSRVSRQHQRQELFSWALAHLIEAPDPESMVKKIFPRISAHIFVDTYFNYFLEPDGRHLRLHSAGGIPRDVQDKIRIVPIGEGLCGTCAERRQPVVIASLHESHDPNLELAKILGLRAYVCNPLAVGDRLIGTLAFASRTRDQFTEDELEFTRVVAQYVAIAIDRSRSEAALRKAEGALRGHAELLEEQVQERTRSLRETIAELESFSYSLAHDVRAPLRHIQGFSEALLEDYGQALPPEARRYVDSILSAIRRLDALTRDILDYSKVVSKPVQLIPLDLENLLGEILSQHASLNAPGVVTVNSPLHPVLGERTLLHQCLANLLGNALKFMPPETAPRITVRTDLRTSVEPANRPLVQATAAPAPMHPTQVSPSPAKKRAGTPAGAAKPPNEFRWVRIWVEDNGIGISPEFHEKIFGIFERLSHQYVGTGIGLAIVSKSVQRMGGQLGLESESGKGSRFWIELPAADPPR